MCAHVPLARTYYYVSVVLGLGMAALQGATAYCAAHLSFADGLVFELQEDALRPLVVTGTPTPSPKTPKPAAPATASARAPGYTYAARTTGRETQTQTSG